MTYVPNMIHVCYNKSFYLNSVKDFINTKVGDAWCEGKSLFSCYDLKLRLGLERDL